MAHNCTRNINSVCIVNKTAVNVNWMWRGVRGDGGNGQKTKAIEIRYACVFRTVRRRDENEACGFTVFHVYYVNYII